jgi:hypothetical protein
MLHDAQAAATVFALAWIGVALMLIAALMELLPNSIPSSLSELPVGVFVILFACAITSASRLVLGTALVGGFVDAYATIPLVVGAIVLGLRFCRAPSPVPLVLLALATIVILFSWSIITFVPGALTVAVSGLAAKDSTRRRSTWTASWLWVVAATIGLAAVLFTLAVGVSQRSALETMFELPGGFAPLQTRVLLLVGLLTLGAVFVVRDRLRRVQMGLVLAVFVLGVLVIRWLTTLPGSGGTWTYYALKTLWLLVSSLMWVAFVPPLLAAAGADAERRAPGWRCQGLSALRAATWSGVVLVVLGLTSSVDQPSTELRFGWFNPSASSVAEVVAAGNTHNRFVFWQWDDPGEDRLANYWAALTWDSTPGGTTIPYAPELPGGLALWASLETGKLGQLCTVVKAVPHIVVITTNIDLEHQLRPVCPHLQARFEITPVTS